jgi:predicted transposase/invertase (TIGR01784 family)
VYYAAKLLLEQIKRGQDWGKLQQVISIVICNHDLLPDEQSYINNYAFRNERTNRCFTDLIKFVILEVPKLSIQEDTKVWPWLKLFICKERSQYDELAQQHPEVGMAIALLKEMSLLGQIRMLADDLEIQRRDKAAIMEYKLDEATEKGLEQGLKKGLEQARQEKLEIARNLKGLGIGPDHIAVATGLSPEKIAEL